MALLCMDVDDIYEWLEENQENQETKGYARARALRKIEHEKRPLREYSSYSGKSPLPNRIRPFEDLEIADWTYSPISPLLQKNPDLKYHWKRLGSQRSDWSSYEAGAYGKEILLVGIDRRLYKEWLERKMRPSDDRKFIVAGIDLLTYDPQGSCIWMYFEYPTEVEKLEEEDRG